MEHAFKHEQLPSGKLILRHSVGDTLIEEHHGYGALQIGITHDFAGIKVAESYFAERRIVSCRTCEKPRVAYSDMPPADAVVEDFGASLLRGAGEQ